MIKHLVVYQTTNGKQTFNVKEAFTSSELETIDKCISALSKFTGFRTLFRMVLDNYLDLTQYLDKEENSETESLKKIGYHTNRLTINYLSSAKLFIEHSEKKIKSLCGKNSQEFNDWKLTTKKEFETYFSYRFLYHLRNFTQHYGFPVGAINKGYVEEGKHNITLFFVRDALITNNYDWHKDVIKDLEGAPEKFPIFKIINEYNGCMARLYQRALSLFAKEIVRDLENYIKLLSSKGLQGSPYCLTFEQPEDIKNPDKYRNLNPLPLDEIYDCFDELQEFKVVNFQKIQR